MSTALTHTRTHACTHAAVVVSHDLSCVYYTTQTKVGGGVSGAPNAPRQK